MPQPQLGPIKFQVGTVSGTAVSHTTAATATAAITTNQQYWSLAGFNSCNQAIGISLNGVEAFRIGVNSPTIFDLSTNGIYIPKGTVIGVYNLGTTPTTGEISLTAIGRDMSNLG